MFSRFDGQKPPAARNAAKRNKSARPQFRAALDDDGTLELLIYGDIVDAATISSLEAWGYDTGGFVSALNVKKALDAAGSSYSKVRLRINSPGGDVFEGMTIHSLLSGLGRPVEACVDGIAASSASVIAMAGRTRVMGRSAMMMIHNAWAVCCGNTDDMVKMSGTLDKIDEAIAESYANRTGMPAADVRALMKAETWMTAQDCMDQGFATAIADLPAEEEAAAQASARRFRALIGMKHVPDRFRGATAECACDCSNCVEGNCPDCTNQDCTDENCTDCPMQADGAGNSIEQERIRLAARVRKLGLVHGGNDEVADARRRLERRSARLQGGAQ